jgi:hypothetical protein
MTRSSRVRCLEVSGCSLRREAGGRVARNESRDIDRRRTAAGLARRVRARPAKLLGAGVPNAIAWRGCCGAGATRARGTVLGVRGTMIVRVSARGQANGSADGYLCAREQLGQAEGPCARRQPEYKDATEGSLSEVTKCYQAIFGRNRDLGDVGDFDWRFACDSASVLDATAGAFTGAEVIGCRVRKPCSSMQSARAYVLRATLNNVECDRAFLAMALAR